MVQIGYKSKFLDKYLDMGFLKKIFVLTYIFVIGFKKVYTSK